jgi:hypothetical protein
VIEMLQVFATPMGRVLVLWSVTMTVLAWGSLTQGGRR